MNPIEYIASLGLTPSDWILFACVIPIGWFLIVYGLFTKWYADPFGWIILSGALGLFGVIAIVIYAVFAGQRIDEVIRIILFSAILVSWIGKDIVLHRERHEGKLEKRHPRVHTGPTPTGKA